MPYHHAKSFIFLGFILPKTTNTFKIKETYSYVLEPSDIYLETDFQIEGDMYLER